MPHLPFWNSTLQLSLSSRTTALIIVETFINTLIALLALLGNCAVLFILCKNPSLRTIPNYFVTALAISDVTFAIFITPWSTTVLITGHWPFSFAVCQFQGFMIVFLASFSLITLTITAVNRYFGIVRNSLHRRYFTPSRTRLYIFTAVALCLFAASISLMAGYVYEFNPGKFICYYKQELWLTMYLVINFVAIPAAIIIICYFKVFQAIREHEKSLHKNFEGASRVGRITVAEIKITKTLFATVVAFLFCWMPVFSVELADLVQGRSRFPRQVYVMFTMCGLTSSAVNPIIYGVMNRSFRKAYKDLFVCCRHELNVIYPMVNEKKEEV